ncbi:MAG TPA: hypothetical protein VM657_09935 [Sphingomonas sp.]|nr:hypothetical protein [Sphingomonas sp.]
MRLLLAAAIASLFGANACAAATSPVDAMHSIIFDDCVRVLEKPASIDDSAAMSALGYTLAQPDDEGLWASKTLGQGVVRIGVGPGKPGCRVRYSGPDSTALYETLLANLLKDGFVFPDGARKPAEAQFVMDTLVQEKGSIGVISMFRMNSPDSADFAVTIFPSFPVQ